MERDDLHFFDRAADWDVVSRTLPHWSQAGAITFVTWRLADSLPSSARRRIDREIDLLLVNEGIDPCHAWRGRVDELPPPRRSVLQFKMFKIRDKFLDEGFGCCCLSSSELAEIVLESLRRFDGERYILTDAVVMPNHVHFLCSFSSETQMLKQCNEWKRLRHVRSIGESTGRANDGRSTSSTTWSAVPNSLNTSDGTSRRTR